MSMTTGEKVKELMKAEGYKAKEFADLLSISFDTLGNYLYRGKDVPSSLLTNIVNRPQFRKYALWLLLDDDNPEQYEKEQVMGVDECSHLLEKLTEEQLSHVLEFMRFVVSKEDKKEE